MDPSHDQWHAKVATAVLPPRRERRQEEAKAPQQARLHRQKKNNTLILIVVVWLGFILLLVFVAGKFGGKPTGSSKPSAGIASAGRMSMADQRLLEKNSRRLLQTMAGYAVSANNEQRSQFVADPIRVSPKMENYFAKNPLIRVDMETMKTRSANVLKLPEGDAIEVWWQSGDLFYETLFVGDEREWKLDWEHFVRYSDEPFSLFLAGTGEAEAEFRLLARERLAGERAKEPEISLALYAPVSGKPRETGVESPEFLVPRHEPDGRRLSAAFAMKRRAENPFGSMSTSMDPDDMIRVRVRLRRTESDEGKLFQIVEVIACHWYGVTDDFGVPEEMELIIPEDVEVDQED